jgi:hypothetical protein
VLVETSGADRVSGWKGDDLFLWFDPALSDTRIGDDHDLLAGGSGDDRAIFYLADRGLYRAARAEYAAADGAKEFELDTLNVSVTGIESVSFVDLSDGAFERPETGSSTLEARLDEAHLWGFV